MIHILDYINPELRHVDHWRTIVPSMLEHNGYDVNIIQGDDLVPNDSGLLGETYYKTSQFASICDNMLRGMISPNDVFIIGDAWNPTVLSIRYMSDIHKLNLKIIGFWRDGIYDVDSKIWMNTVRQPRQWSRAFERSLFTAYDYNCFLSQVRADKFKSRYNFKRDNKVVVSGFPYGGIRELRDAYPHIEKEDIIVLPHDSFNEDQRDIFKALQRYLSDYKFVDCAELRLSRTEYYDVLIRAKGIMAINLSESDPTNIYEGMVFGCVPIVPNRLVYNEVFPEKYHYNSYYTQPPMLNFVRGREYMHNAIRNVIDNYSKLSDELFRDSIDIENKYFSNDELLRILKELV